MRRTILILGVILLAGVARPTRASFITNISASTTMGSGLGSDIQNTVDASGLGAGPLFTAPHAKTDPSNSWVGSQGVLFGDVVFDLKGTFLVDQLSVWNYNGGDPGSEGAAGVRVVVVLSSTDGVSYRPIPGMQMFFAKATGPVVQPETFVFSPLPASHLKFTILGNYGDKNYTGLGEIAVQGAIVPEPSSLVLCGMFGVASLGWAGLRRRSRTKA